MSHLIFASGVFLLVFPLGRVATLAVFLIPEMDTPLDGVVRVPIGAMREASARPGGQNASGENR